MLFRQIKLSLFIRFVDAAISRNTCILFENNFRFDIQDFIIPAISVFQVSQRRPQRNRRPSFAALTNIIIVGAKEKKKQKNIF